MPDQSQGVLAGVRVLDVSQLLPGPWAAQVLGDLGATVTKVEPPGGDSGREIRGDLFDAANRNKRSVVADLKTDAGRQRLLSLAAGSDVLVEGFRPGVMDRLGVGYADVRRVNEGIVYCSISGYGADGAMRDFPGHDINYLAASGALSFTGHWGEPPRRPGVPMADLASSCFAVIAIVSALYERDTGGGHGGHLVVSMTDTMSAWAAARGGRRLERDADDRRHLYPTNDMFLTRDGRWLAVGAVEERFWTEVRAVLSEDEPRVCDGRFTGVDGRIEHGDELQALLAGTFARRDLDEWLAMFKGTDAPVSPVRSLVEMAEATQATEASEGPGGEGIVRSLDGQRHVVFPVRLDGEVMGKLRSTAASYPGYGNDGRGE